MITVKVTYDDGDYTVTGFNGTLDEAVRYFLGSTFNLGTERDDMHRCVKVELLGDEPTKSTAGIQTGAVYAIWPGCRSCKLGRRGPGGHQID